MSPTNAGCIYHPEVVAVSVCSECAGRICRACENLVANKPVCGPCVQRIREKIANEQPVMPLPAAYAGGQYIQDSSATHAMLKGPAPKATPAGLGLGFLGALAVATVGAIAWAKIYLMVNFMLSIGYIFIGMGAAMAMNKISKTHGPTNGVIAVVATTIGMAIGMAIGHIVYIQDAVAQQCSHIGFGPEALTLAF